MAYRGENDVSIGPDLSENSEIITLQGNETHIDLPDSSFVRDADMLREGMDLVLETSDASITIEGYFAYDGAPDLVAPDGSSLTPDLIDSFAHSPAEYAQNMSMTDVSPVGAVEEFTGQATVTRTDGTIDQISTGTEIYEGDIIETGTDGAVNIVFVDETSFAVSENARMAIDEYVFDPATEGGVQNFSVLKGVFVFTSGLIGREDPDDVEIDTPVGSIGIRGTIIAGDVDGGEITVVEGAIVLRDFNGNEVTLANQFETAQFDPTGGSITPMGQLSAADVGVKFASVSNVSPQLFSSINDAAAEQNNESGNEAQAEAEATEGENQNEPQEQQEQKANEAVDQQGGEPQNNAEGSVDQNGDNEVDGTVDDGSQEPAEAKAEAESQQQQAEAEAQAETEAQQQAEADTQIEQQQQSEPKPQPSETLQTKAELGADKSGLAETRQKIVAERVKAEIKKQIQLEQQEQQQPQDTAAADGTTEPLADTTTTNVTDTSNTPPPEVYNDTTNAPPPPPNNSTPPPPNGAVQHRYEAPEDFFTATDGTSWFYHFNKDFRDSDPDGSVQFDVTNVLYEGTNYTNFDALVYDSMSNPSGILMNWDISQTDGKLTLDFVSGISADKEIQFDITANDGDGSVLTQTYDYDVKAVDSYNSSGSVMGDSGEEIIIDSTSGNSIGLGGLATADKVVFMGDENDTVTFVDGSATRNQIHMGNGENTININDSAVTDNTVFGGFDHDTFNMNSVRNELFGMDGDDDFILNTTNTAVIDDLYDASDFSIKIDGNYSDFRALDALGELSQNDGIGALNRFRNFSNDTHIESGRGDSFILDSNADAAVDFRLISNEHIKNIERIDADNGQFNAITMSFDDVVSMNDHKLLIINLDTSDRLDLVGPEFINFNLVKSNFLLDDNLVQTTTTADDTAYDVYVGQDGMTLLVTAGSEAGGKLHFHYDGYGEVDMANGGTQSFNGTADQNINGDIGDETVNIGDSNFTENKNVFTKAGDDVVNIIDGDRNDVITGAGQDSVKIGVSATDSSYNSIYTGIGDDGQGVAGPIEIKNGHYNLIDTGDGHDVVEVGTEAHSHHNQVYTGTGDDVVKIKDGDNNTVHMHDGNDTVYLGVTGSTYADYNFVNTGDGNDSIYLKEGIDNRVEADQGNDNLYIEETNNFMFGNEGNDTFHLDFTNFTNLQTDLNSSSAAGYQINGGSNVGATPTAGGTYSNAAHGDIVKFMNGNIDFTAIGNDYFNNIETIGIADGASNTVTLDFQDIFKMTDENNTLVIKTDNTGDSVNFDDALGGDLSSNVGTATIGTDTYDVYSITDGSDTVTLLIDQDATANTV